MWGRVHTKVYFAILSFVVTQCVFLCLSRHSALHFFLRTDMPDRIATQMTHYFAALSDIACGHCDVHYKYVYHSTLVMPAQRFQRSLKCINGSSTHDCTSTCDLFRVRRTHCVLFAMSSSHDDKTVQHSMFRTNVHSTWEDLCL